MNLSLFLLVILLGILSGIITGLFPGIHINMISTLVLLNTSFLLNYFEINYLIIYIISMGITHSFIDFIPSILFGIPNADTSISIIPAHRLVLNGEAYLAIFLSSIGSLFGLFFAIIITPLFILFLNKFYSQFKEYILFLLIIIIIYLILLEKDLNHKFWALIITIFSAGLGVLALNSYLIQSPLLILFSGIFGLSSLINSLIENQNSYPKQRLEINFKFNKDFFKSIFIGGFSSTLCSITPGIGNSQAAILSTIFFKNINSRLFIIVTSSINTINFILSFLTFYLISKTRNGAVYVISQLTTTFNTIQIELFSITIIITAIIGFIITIILGKIIIQTITKINFKRLNISIILLIIFIVYYLTNIYGLILLISSTSLGLLTILLGIQRVHLMNVLLIPIIFNLI